MSEWWTYSVSDFLLFSPRTYYRLFELYNRAIWPAHIVALALGAVIVGLVRSRAAWSGRALAIILATCWLWVAWAYFLEHYNTINWVAFYFAAGFVVQGLLLLLAGLVNLLRVHPRAGLRGAAGFAMLLFALLVQPIIGPLLSRPWTQVEVFGIAPDPTTIATLGIIVASEVRLIWWLVPIPVVWCVISAATLWTMGSPDALVPLATACLCLFLVGRARFRNPDTRHGGSSVESC
jgi:hypothetical protein